MRWLLMVAGLLSKFGDKQAQKLIPSRKKTSNKNSGGKSLIIAGSAGMFGAAVLAATGALRVGSGYVTLMTDQKNFPITENPDFLLANMKIKNISKISFTALAIGPGLGKSNLTLKILLKLINLKIKNVVIDADALNVYAKNKKKHLLTTWVATPHEGELSRLIGISADQIRQNRAAAIKIAQKKLGCIVLLKGHKTLVATENKIIEIQSGNKALAKAGTGDVLTGMITGFLAQGLSALEAACLGAYVHGAIADEWVNEKNDYLSLIASDLLVNLPRTLKKIRIKKV